MCYSNGIRCVTKYSTNNRCVTKYSNDNQCVTKYTHNYNNALYTNKYKPSLKHQTFFFPRIGSIV